MTTAYPPATPHGPITRVFDDLFWVQGSIDMGQGIRISRNMTIIRQGSDLTLISPVRLTEPGLERLDSLGRVKHLVQLGAYHLGAHHGLDNAFYRERYQATLWGLPGMEMAGEQSYDCFLSQESMPVSGARLFTLCSAALPEAILILDRDGGVAVAADSLQNWAKVDEFFSEQAADLLTRAGFIRPANIGPEWRSKTTPSPQELHQIKALGFCHLLPSHGTPLLDRAGEAIGATIDELYPLAPVAGGSL